MAEDTTYTGQSKKGATAAEHGRRQAQAKEEGARATNEAVAKGMSGSLAERALSNARKSMTARAARGPGVDFGNLGHVRHAKKESRKGSGGRGMSGRRA